MAYGLTVLIFAYIVLELRMRGLFRLYISVGGGECVICGLWIDMFCTDDRGHGGGDCLVYVRVKERFLVVS